MWWNNVETKPGTGYPTRWEDQETWRGGWENGNGSGLHLKAQGKLGGLLKLFYNPRQPGLDDYYEPWTYRYNDLFDAPAGNDQPTAVPVSQITGKPIDIQAGPNWDDDLSGSPVYAANDPNLDALPDDEREALFAIERLVMAYLPRTCNHCVNPACVASCPSGAMYKRGEDGVVLVNQDKCRGWRACVVGCPYKKTYFNWQTGKSEKCILCYPRIEAGQAPACFHSCVGRIRYTGVVLYDASRIEELARVPNDQLVAAQRSLLLDPFDPEVVAAASKNGIGPQMIAAAQQSPVWKFVREWGLALPLHPEYRTLPMIFYVPPLLPVMKGSTRQRMPLSYLASLFSAGNIGVVESALQRLVSVREFKRTSDPAGLEKSGLTPAQAEAIYRMTTLATVEERFVLPPLQREVGVAAEELRQSSGFGSTAPPARGA
jgi:nitrate reductase beta subunit